MLSDEQKSEASLLARVGCDRETLAAYLGCGHAALTAAIETDGCFAVSLRRAEAGCELAHLRTIQQAARDERHWRASVWWLERRRPDRYRRPASDAPTGEELTAFLTSVAEAIAEWVTNPRERRAVLAALERLLPTPPAPVGSDQSWYDDGDDGDDEPNDEEPFEADAIP